MALDRKIFALGFVAAGALAAASCATTDSANVKTTGIYARYILEQVADGDYTATAAFRVGGPTGTLVELSGGEAVFFDGLELNTKNKVEGISITYSRTLPKATADKVFAIEFRRTGAEVVQSSIQAPEPFTLTSSASAGTYADTFTLTWTPLTTRGAKVSVTATPSDSTRCDTVFLASDQTDTGSVSFPGAKLTPKNVEGGAPPDCTFEIKVERTDEKPVGGPYQGGVLESTAIQKVGLTVRP